MARITVVREDDQGEFVENTCEILIDLTIFLDFAIVDISRIGDVARGYHFLICPYSVDKDLFYFFWVVHKGKFKVSHEKVNSRC